MHESLSWNYNANSESLSRNNANSCGQFDLTLKRVQTDIQGGEELTRSSDNSVEMVRRYTPGWLSDEVKSQINASGGREESAEMNVFLVAITDDSMLLC